MSDNIQKSENEKNEKQPNRGSISPSISLCKSSSKLKYYFYII